MESNAVEESSKIRAKENQLDWAVRRSLLTLPEGSANEGSGNHTPLSSRDCCIEMSEVELREVLYTGWSSAFLGMMGMHSDQTKKPVIKNYLY